MSSFPEDQILKLDAYRPAPLKRYRFVDIRTSPRQESTPEATTPALQSQIAPFWAEAIIVIGIVVVISEPWRSEMALLKVILPIVFGLVGLMLADANINKRRSAFKAHCARSREVMYLKLQEQALQS